LARIASASVFVGVVLVVGCGSGSSPADGGFPDNHTNADSGVDAPADVSSNDVIVPGEGSTEDGPVGDGGCAGAGKKDCESCCSKAEPKGKKAFELAELGCACKPDLCGAKEGGKGTGMGLGEGACVADCKDRKSAATKECAACLADAKGSKTKPGMCYTDINTKCEGESGCMEYQACIASCS
jgi:hypothetical protein